MGQGPLLQNTRARWFVCGLAMTLAYASVQAARYLGTPDIGHDYAYFLPYLLSNHYWMLNNGWSIPWMTPAHCAGIPYFANPQSLFYSPVQALMWLGADPVVSLMVQHILMMALGFTGMWLLAGYVSKRVEIQLLLALLFIANGFVASRLAVGHVSFAVWLLVPLICVLLTTHSSVAAGALAGVLLSSFVHLGASVLIVPCGLAILVVILCLGRMSMVNTAIAALVALALSAGKLVAMVTFMQQFPRDLYPLPGTESLFSGVVLLASGLFWPPDAATINEMVKNRVFAFGADELNYHIGLVPLLIMMLAAARWFAQGRPFAEDDRHGHPWFRSGMVGAVLALAVLVNVHAPGWHDLLQALPYFDTVSSAFRWFLIWILPVLLATAWVLRSLPERISRFVALASIPLVLAFAEWHAPTPWQPYDPSIIIAGYHGVDTGKDVPAVHYLAESLVDGRRRYVTGAGDVLVDGGSQIVCNEPVFGYVLERFRFDRVGRGPVRAMTPYGVNFYRPECFLYPEANTCRAGDVFQSVADPRLKALLTYQDYPFEKPLLVSAAVLVSQGAIVALLLLFGFTGWRAIRLRQKERQERDRHE